MMKRRSVVLYHPATVGCQVNFEQVLDELSALRKQQMIVLGPDNESKYVVTIKTLLNKYVIIVQKLKIDDLPRIAQEADGQKEAPLVIPEGMSLSFKNIFIFDRDKNILAMSVLGSCPQVGALQRCLKELMRKYIDGCERGNCRFAMIMERGFTDALRDSTTITMAEFTSKDFYGESISEDRFDAYEKYLGGIGYTQKVKLRGIRGMNLKEKLLPVIDDIISYGLPPEEIGIKMAIDGEDINFSKYYKKYHIWVRVGGMRNKSLDYNDLERKMTQIVDGFRLDGGDA